MKIFRGLPRPSLGIPQHPRLKQGRTASPGDPLAICYDGRVAYDPNNIFAKILRGEAQAHVVLDEADCLAFMDVMPQSPGHTLVIPKAPVANVFDIDADHLARLIATTQRVARAVYKAFTPGGVMVMQLNGADAGQTVFHLHFHVIPRYAGEGLTLHARSMAKPETLDEHAARIRTALVDDGTR